MKQQNQSNKSNKLDNNVKKIRNWIKCSWKDNGEQSGFCTVHSCIDNMFCVK